MLRQFDVSLLCEMLVDNDEICVPISCLRHICSHFTRFACPDASSPLHLINHHPPPPIPHHSSSMSSLADVAMRSDAPEEFRSDASSVRRRTNRSSSRPRGPPSVSTPAMQSDMAFPDDEIVGLRGLRRNNLPGAGDIPRVVDATSETLGTKFQKFLEEYAHHLITMQSSY
jgi:hypothetical protein